MPAPPAEQPPSHFDWSREERVRELLIDAFELTFERGTNVLRLPSGQIMWDIFVEGFGPIKALAAPSIPQGALPLSANLCRYTRGIAHRPGSLFRGTISSRYAYAGNPDHWFDWVGSIACAEGKNFQRASWGV